MTESSGRDTCGPNERELEGVRTKYSSKTMCPDVLYKVGGGGDTALFYGHIASRDCVLKPKDSSTTTYVERSPNYTPHNGERTSFTRPRGLMAKNACNHVISPCEALFTYRQTRLGTRCAYDGVTFLLSCFARHLEAGNVSRKFRTIFVKTTWCR